MTKALSAIVGAVLLGSGAAYAAPDNTFGMALLSAVVNADATVARGSGVVSVTPQALAGQYVVTFDRNVRDCAYTATTGLSGFIGIPNPGGITVVAFSNDVTGVYVETFDMAGALAARGFHLNVFCHK